LVLPEIQAKIETLDVLYLYVGEGPQAASFNLFSCNGIPIGEEYKEILEEKVKCHLARMLPKEFDPWRI
jgi:hypothetical protein